MIELSRVNETQIVLSCGVKQGAELKRYWLGRRLYFEGCLANLSQSDIETTVNAAGLSLTSFPYTFCPLIDICGRKEGALAPQDCTHKITVWGNPIPSTK